MDSQKFNIIAGIVVVLVLSVVGTISYRDKRYAREVEQRKFEECKAHNKRVLDLIEQGKEAARYNVIALQKC